MIIVVIININLMPICSAAACRVFLGGRDITPLAGNSAGSQTGEGSACGEDKIVVMPA